MPTDISTWTPRNRRMMPPPAGASPAVAFPNGRRVTCAIGSTVDVDQNDSDILESNGWQRVADFSGPTSRRPKWGDPDFSVGHPVGVRYYDTTTSALLVCDASGTWRTTAGAAA